MSNATLESHDLAAALRESALPITGAATDYDALLDLIGEAQFVLIGEASHGTHEFYQQRAEITQRLIREEGFNAVAVEADWPDAYRVNRYVRGTSDDATAYQALDGFKRFPAWMWRNTVVLDFIYWLRQHNDQFQAAQDKAGFYGLDLYSLYASVAFVLEYLDRMDPEAAKRARYRYSCLEHFGEDPQIYGYAASFDLSESCENDVTTALVELQRRAAEYARRNGLFPEDEFFFAEQNARVVQNAERYYRAMFHGRVNSWNLRDRHMAGTLDALTAHLSRRIERPRVVVWAHNSHLGDARATEMGEHGELNVGQLASERYGRDAILIGLTTHHGSVTAASDWDGPVECKCVRPALPANYEALFHQISTGDRQPALPGFFLNLRDCHSTAAALRESRLERAIGVIYRPESEHMSHYFFARLAEQFDAVLHFDETRAVEPLERMAEWQTEEPPETYPIGI